jgi:hypothetical protein
MVDKKPLEHILQELCNLTAVHCHEMIFADRADGEDKEGQIVLLFKVFHGSACHSSVVNTPIESTGPHESAHFRVPMENNCAEGNENHDTVMLQLLCLLTCDEGEQRTFGASFLRSDIGN